MAIDLQSCAATAGAYLGYDFESLLDRRFGTSLIKLPIEVAIPQIANHLALKVDRHWNGFIRIILEMDRSCFASVRVHYWPEQDVTALAADIHSHAWDFYSFVIAGSLEISQFEESVGTAYHRNIAATGKQLLGETKEGLCGLKKDRTVIVENGFVHRASTGTIHCVAPSAVPSVTLFFQGPHKSAFSNFYSIDKRSVVHPVDLLPSELGILSERLRDILGPSIK